jgi:hypothetical protein
VYNENRGWVMKEKFPKYINKFRVKTGLFKSTAASGFNGCFIIPRGGRKLTVIVSDEVGWDHVSVSLKNRTPTWDDMVYIKNLFWDDSETVLQFHPPKSDYVNIHKHCLHLWKNQRTPVELPPLFMV